MNTNEIRNGNGQTEKEFFEAYDSNEYNSTKFPVTSDILIFTIQNEEGKEDSNDLDDKRLKIALIQRADFPEINKWALPGGFVNKGEETTYQAALRELEEETSLNNMYLEQLYTFDDIKRDKRDHILTVSYMSLVDSTQLKLKAGSDAKKAEWFEISNKVLKINKTLSEKGFIREKFIKIKLTNKDIKLEGVVKEITIVEGRIRKSKLEVVEKGDIAFDHIMIISYALDRLKNKVEYTDIMYNLLPELFTIAQAYKVYQIITGKEDTNQNFRKKFSKMWVETNQKSKQYSPKPAMLYKLNINWDEE